MRCAGSPDVEYELGGYWRYIEPADRDRPESADGHLKLVLALVPSSPSLFLIFPTLSSLQTLFLGSCFLLFQSVLVWFGFFFGEPLSCLSSVVLSSELFPHSCREEEEVFVFLVVSEFLLCCVVWLVLSLLF